MSVWDGAAWRGATALGGAAGGVELTPENHVLRFLPQEDIEEGLRRYRREMHRFHATVTPSRCAVTSGGSTTRPPRFRTR